MADDDWLPLHRVQNEVHAQPALPTWAGPQRPSLARERSRQQLIWSILMGGGRLSAPSYMPLNSRPSPHSKSAGSSPRPASSRSPKLTDCTCARPPYPPERACAVTSQPTLTVASISSIFSWVRLLSLAILRRSLSLVVFTR